MSGRVERDGESDRQRTELKRGRTNLHFTSHVFAYWKLHTGSAKGDLHNTMHRRIGEISDWHLWSVVWNTKFSKKTRVKATSNTGSQAGLSSTFLRWIFTETQWRETSYQYEGLKRQFYIKQRRIKNVITKLSTATVGTIWQWKKLINLMLVLGNKSWQWILASPIIHITLFYNHIPFGDQFRPWIGAIIGNIWL